MPSKYGMETFDDICNGPTQSILFRLHSRSANATSFDERRKRLAASILDPRSFSRAVEELSQNKQSFFIDVEDDVELIQRHINSIADRDRQPSHFISLTLNLLWVLWKWKLLTSMGFRDDFQVIVIKSSELVGRAKLATEVLQAEREEHRRAYRFADSAEEVIVAKIVQPQAILGAVSLSRITEFIPSWLRGSLANVRRRRGFEDDDEVPESSFNTFLEVLNPPNDDVKCMRDSLSLALAILAPMLVQSKQEEEPDLVDLLSNLVISQQAPENGNLGGYGQGGLRTTNTGRDSTRFADESNIRGSTTIVRNMPGGCWDNTERRW
ncbi:hypothetical protein BGW80DRAFT_359503 [Lactifluus volemus]|nr:hypothetical protein BGW80DRAFT_359503 [Lactifluus volemus]